MNLNHLSALLIALMMTTGGCTDPAAQVAHEAAQRQAEQNVEMSKVNQGVLQVTQQLHQERAQLNDSRDDLEAERRAMAGERRTESAIAAVTSSGGAVLVALFALALAWAILTALPRSDDSAEALCELLASDLSGESPQFIEPVRLAPGDSPLAIARSRPQEPEESL